MANTCTQIYLHVVFAVSGRACVISSEHREELQKYITGIVTRKGQKLIAIYCMPDHTHLLLGLKSNIAPSDLIGDIKTGSTNRINERRWIGCHFSLAGRLRRVLSLPFAPRSCHPRHIRPALHFQAHGVGPNVEHAAPTELRFMLGR